MEDQLTTEQRALLAQLHGTIRKAARFVARRFGINPDDLIGIGFLAAVEVTRTFDSARNDDVSKFGFARIAGEMLDVVGKERRTDQAQLLASAHRFASKASATVESPDPFAADETLKLELESAVEVLAAVTVVAISGARVQPDPEQIVDDTRLGSTLERAIRRLSDEHRRLVDLVFFEELTLDEAAVALGLSPRTARRRKREALESLRDALLAEHQELPE
ncbi:MAG: sigma-70 family RNA polymerase sigma factor [Myxococcales bacterium]|nr:sigma-70 family RNA polymerase sigma factor [Myxococcales bacterium]